MTRRYVTKAVLAALGLAAGLAGIALDARPLVGLAVGLLVAAFVIRLIERRAGAPARTHQPTPEGDA
jgi:hypothetical protein